MKESKQTSAGLKYDAGKPSIGLIDQYALWELAKVLDYGKHKYDAHNWRKGIQWQRTIDAALRHVLAFNGGEDFDPESGLPHLAHAMCNLMFLLNFTETHPELDDRHKPTLQKAVDATYGRFAQSQADGYGGPDVTDPL